MNKFIKIFVIGLTSTILLQSCSSFLDTSPSTGVDGSTAVTNEENATAALIGVYDGLQNYYYYGRDFVVQGDVATDNVRLNPTNSNRFITELTWAITKSTANVAYFWNKSYETINRANNIINANISGNEEIINSIKGEAYALRALVHFDLVRMYAQSYDFTSDHKHLGVPYIFVFDPQGTPKRNTVTDVYQYIIADLKKAQELGVGKFSRSMPPNTLTPEAVNAILAKVYLYMGDYDNAKLYAELVIPKYTLVSHDNYLKSWGEESTTESIFAIAHTTTDYPSTNALGYLYNENGYGDIIVNPNLYNLYSSNDVRKGWFVYGTKNANKEKLYPSGKYPGRGNIGLDNFNVLRLSELYLIAAEAAAKTKNEAEARVYLNAIRQRAIPDAPAVTASGQALINEILLEKRKELAFEGNYLHDLKRLKLDVTSGLIDGKASTVITYPNDLFAWPIPERETNANQNIEQNPGY